MQVLNGVKIVKLYAWETPFIDRITEVIYCYYCCFVHTYMNTIWHLFLQHNSQIRNNELKVLKSTAYLNAVSSFSWTAAPFIVSLVTFVCYTTTGHDLTPEKAFVSLSLFNLLRFPLAMLPYMITSLVEADVSRKRLTDYLLKAEV